MSFDKRQERKKQNGQQKRKIHREFSRFKKT